MRKIGFENLLLNYSKPIKHMEEEGYSKNYIFLLKRGNQLAAKNISNNRCKYQHIGNSFLLNLIRFFTFCIQSSQYFRNKRGPKFSKHDVVFLCPNTIFYNNRCFRPLMYTMSHQYLPIIDKFSSHL